MHLFGVICLIVSILGIFISGLSFLGEIVFNDSDPDTTDFMRWSFIISLIGGFVSSIICSIF